MNKEKALSRMRAALRQVVILAQDYGVDVMISADGEKSAYIRMGDWEMWYSGDRGVGLRYMPLPELEEGLSRVGEWEGPVEDARFNGFKNPPKEKEDALQTAK